MTIKDTILSTTAINSHVGMIEGNQAVLRQNIKPFLENANKDRELARDAKIKTPYRKFATIPDIVALDVFTKHKINIHDDMHARDPQTMAKFKQIIRTEYPHLVVNK